MNLRYLSTVTVCAALITGCTAVPPLNFTPEIGRAEHRLDAELKSVNVDAAKPDRQLGRIDIGFGGNVAEASFKQSFKGSLESALVKSLIFKDDAPQKVSLMVEILKFQSPGTSVRFKTSVVVNYRIIDRATGDLLYDKDITSEGEVPGDYAFAGAVRFIEARNRAGQANIKAFIEDLEATGLKQTTAADN